MSISIAQHAYLSHILNQKELDPEVVGAVRLILAGEIQATSEDVKQLITVLSAARDRKDTGWRDLGWMIWDGKPLV